MALTTYAELLTAISDYIGARTDLGSVDDNFVTLAEARLNYGDYGTAFPTPPLRVRQMEQRSTATATGEYIALPDNFLETKYLKVTSENPDKPLMFLPPSMFDRKVGNSSTGTPAYYTVFGSEYRLNPVPGSVTLESGFYRTIPALSSAVNWLYTASPAVYLYGSLLEAAIYIDENEDIAKYGNLYSGLLLGMNASGTDSGMGQPIQAATGVNLMASSVVRI